MTDKEIDEQTGAETTGHAWDGIEELDTPLPRWWLRTFYATGVWGLICVILIPAVPLVEWTTAGVLGWPTRGEIAAETERVALSNAELTGSLTRVDLAVLEENESLYAFAVSAGSSVFRNNCSQCHGADAAGVVAAGYPNLLDDGWLWGGRIEDVADAVRHGIRSEADPDSRWSRMPAFGAFWTDEEIMQTVRYVRSLSDLPHDPALAAGGAVLSEENRAACHGQDGMGDGEQGAPKLTDAIWLYRGDEAAIEHAIRHSRFGVMAPLGRAPGRGAGLRGLGLRPPARRRDGGRRRRAGRQLPRLRRRDPGQSGRAPVAPVADQGPAHGPTVGGGRRRADRDPERRPRRHRAGAAIGARRPPAGSASTGPPRRPRDVGAPAPPPGAPLTWIKVPGAAARQDGDAPPPGSPSGPLSDQPLLAARGPVFPRRVTGFYRSLKWWVMAATPGVYDLVPWIRRDRGPNLPHQAMHMDLAHRRFYLSWIEIWPHEFQFVAGLLIMAGLGLFLFTSARGRVCSGCACPQTAWTDLFPWVERRIEGDRNARIRLRKRPWDARRRRLRGAKRAAWLAIAVAAGGAWVFHFADTPTLAAQPLRLEAPPVACATIAILTATTFVLGGFLRGQVSISMCPRPRIQGAMVDEGALAVGYREWRGEPRGKCAGPPPRRRRERAPRTGRPIRGRRGQGRRGATHLPHRRGAGRLHRLHRLHGLRERLPDGHRHPRGPADGVHHPRPGASTPATT